MICVTVCKTFIHRFDSDPRLQVNSTETKDFVAPATHFAPAFEATSNPQNPDLSGERLAKSLTAILTTILTAPEVCL